MRRSAGDDNLMRFPLNGKKKQRKEERSDELSTAVSPTFFGPKLLSLVKFVFVEF